MQTRHEILQVREALRMLYELLESYAPVWYTRSITRRPRRRCARWKGK